MISAYAHLSVSAQSHPWFCEDAIMLSLKDSEIALGTPPHALPLSCINWSELAVEVFKKCMLHSKYLKAKQSDPFFVSRKPLEYFPNTT